MAFRNNILTGLNSICNCMFVQRSVSFDPLWCCLSKSCLWCLMGNCVDTCTFTQLLIFTSSRVCRHYLQQCQSINDTVPKCLRDTNVWIKQQLVYMIFFIWIKATGNSLFIYGWHCLNFVIFRMVCLTDNMDFPLFNNSDYLFIVYLPILRVRRPKMVMA